MYNLEVTRVGQIFSTLYFSNFGVELIIIRDRIDFFSFTQPVGHFYKILPHF